METDLTTHWKHLAVVADVVPRATPLVVHHGRDSPSLADAAVKARDRDVTNCGHNAASLVMG